MRPLLVMTSPSSPASNTWLLIKARRCSGRPEIAFNFRSTAIGVGWGVAIGAGITGNPRVYGPLDRGKNGSTPSGLALGITKTDSTAAALSANVLVVVAGDFKFDLDWPWALGETTVAHRNRSEEHTSELQSRG